MEIALITHELAFQLVHIQLFYVCRFMYVQQMTEFPCYSGFFSVTKKSDLLN